MSSSTYVSVFENLVKPIASPTIPFVRTAISGYFCTVSNLGPFDEAFRFLVVLPRFIPPGAPGEIFADREYTTSIGPQIDPSGVANHSAIYDITGGPAQGQTAVGELIYVGATDCVKVYLSPAYNLCKAATAQLALLPFLGPGPNLIARDLFEVRGWVAIARTAQLTTRQALRVLVSPEQRGTFIPVNVADPTQLVPLADLDQINTSLATGTPSGGAFAELTPPSAATPKVQAFADANAIPAGRLSPFNDVLDPIL
jgi:hypothetical protein